MTPVALIFHVHSFFNEIPLLFVAVGFGTKGLGNEREEIWRILAFKIMDLDIEIELKCFASQKPIIGNFDHIGRYFSDICGAEISPDITNIDV